jgi:ferric-dicitrate binding protein FerR (iron transport regulator)
MLKNYSDVEELLIDESFLGWHFKSDKDAISKWESWIAETPEKMSLVREAIGLLDTMQISDINVSGTQTRLAEEKLFAHINSSSETVSNPSILIRRRRWFIAVAAFLVLITGAWLLKYLTNSKAELKTTYGEIKSQKLPDGSDVFLNANSQVSYADEWKEGNDREVWITGEAYFHVQKTPGKSRFIVHTQQFDIIVTGTQFNVVDRNDKANVLLREGGIILKTIQGKEIIMKPGDFIEFNNAEPAKKDINNDNIIAWKDKKIVFENTPLFEAIGLIKEHYGVTIKLSNDSLGKSTLTGMLPNDNLDVLLEALAALNEFKVTHQDNEIIITNKTQP